MNSWRQSTPPWRPPGKVFFCNEVGVYFSGFVGMWRLTINYKHRWWQLQIFFRIFTPTYLGTMNPIWLEHIFLYGLKLNHQLGILSATWTNHHPDHPTIFNPKALMTNCATLAAEVCRFFHRSEEGLVCFTGGFFVGRKKKRRSYRSVHGYRMLWVLMAARCWQLKEFWEFFRPKMGEILIQWWRAYFSDGVQLNHQVDGCFNFV